MPKKIPMRTCVGCGTVRPKKELIRVVMTPEGEILPDRLREEIGGTDAG